MSPESPCSGGDSLEDELQLPLGWDVGLFIQGLLAQCQDAPVSGRAAVYTGTPSHSAEMSVSGVGQLLLK